jgi:hypothetical protein
VRCHPFLSPTAILEFAMAPEPALTPGTPPNAADGARARPKSLPLKPLLALLALTVGAQAAASEGACLDWRWIGVGQSDAPNCAAMAPAGWRGQALFAELGTETPPGLRRYCLFESDAVNPTDLTQLPGVAEHFVALDRDCAGVAPQSAGSLSELQWPTLEVAFEQQAGIPNNATVSVGSAGVRLAVLDSNPTNALDPETQIGASPHGNALITMAEQLLCTGQASCSVQVTSRLALSHVRVNPQRRVAADIDESGGGHLGSIAELAAAVYRETSAWRKSGSGNRLVMNISLGWSADLGGGEAQLSAMPAAVQAAFAAIADARCRSALVFAAAGNHAGDPSDQRDALLPAAWETRAAPGLNACRQLLGAAMPLAASEFIANAYRPLVHAVSGIEADGSELDNARALGTARLAAYGDHAVVQSQASAQVSPTLTLTGSSVASLLASVNAALAWSHQPQLSSHQITALLHDAALGTDSVLPRSADLCLRTAAGSCAAGVSPMSHRLSLCQTAVALGLPGLSSSDCAWTAGNPELGLEYGAYDSAAFAIDLTRLTASALRPECAGAALRYDPARGLPLQPCPHLGLPGLGEQPWLLPQPGSNLCPSCQEDGPPVLKRAMVGSWASKLGTPRTLRIEITPRFGERVTSLSLAIGNVVYALPLPRDLRGGDRLRITGVETLPGGTERSLIAFAVNGQFATTSTVLYAE